MKSGSRSSRIPVRKCSWAPKDEQAALMSSAGASMFRRSAMRQASAGMHSSGEHPPEMTRPTSFTLRPARSSAMRAARSPVCALEYCAASSAPRTSRLRVSRM